MTVLSGGTSRIYTDSAPGDLRRAVQEQAVYVGRGGLWFFCCGLVCAAVSVMGQGIELYWGMSESGSFGNVKRSRIVGSNAS